MTQEIKPARISWYFWSVFLLFALTNMISCLHIGSWGAATVTVIATALIVYPLLEMVPAVLIIALLFFFTRKWQQTAKRAVLSGAVLFLCIFPLHLILLFDAMLYFRYGYHINPHIMNIFMTPGGFEAMGMTTKELVEVGLGITVLAGLHAGLLIFLAQPRRLAEKGIPRNFLYSLIAAAALLAIFLPTNMFTYSYAHFKMNSEPLLAANAIPMYIPVTSASFFKKLGLVQPDREGMLLKLRKDVSLSGYPANPIRRTPLSERKRYNIIWLACESWAARLYSPEIMPATAKFAKKGITFRNHFSTGNVTRQGVFGMFYALPGSYWHPFFAARRSPLLLDWLKEDGYTFDCITSSKFSYPEFDQTVFVNVPGENLISDYKGATWERDQRNIKRLLEILNNRSAGKDPFFAFMFFESSHHPYSFPKESIVYPDYIEPFNAVQTTEKDGPAIFRRAANTARHLDQCLAKIYRFLEEKDLLKNTIVVLAGDHGEEYYEKGRLGHSSEFNNEQTKTTLILYYPGITPGEYTKMSSHMDIVPMLAKHFGVQNPASDYSCGMDLLDESQVRRYALIADWDRVFFAGEKYKSLLPLDALSYASQTVTDGDDKPLDSTSEFYREYTKDLIRVQHDLARFTTQADKK